MIVVDKKFYKNILFANKLGKLDIFKAICYFSYRGDPNTIPFYYHVKKGGSAVSDLRKTLDELLADMKSNTRNEIRRAEREGCTFMADKDFENFIPYYNAFCESKGLLDRMYMDRLTRYTGDNEVIITKALHGTDILTMHATVANRKEKTAYLIFSCSQRFDVGIDRKLIGWGNRYLHYKDFEYLKSIGIEDYDWSGVILDPNDETYSIGQFKLSFGGTYVDSYVLTTPLFRILEKIRSIVLKWL